MSDYFFTVVANDMTREAIAQELLNGGDGGEVKQRIRETYKTLASLSTEMSRVRTIIKARVKEQCSTLQSFTDAGVKDFLSESLANQVRIQREHGESPSWCDAAEEELRRLILPISIEHFALTREENLQLKKDRDQGLNKKNDELISIDNPLALYWEIFSMLEHAKPKNSYAKLILPLAFASGRRDAELLNQKSTFAPISGHDYYCIFEGQLKKKDGEAKAYVIPLLVPYRIFKRGIDAVKERQAHFDKKRKRGKSTTEMTNEDIHGRYQGRLEKDMKRGIFSFLPNKDVHEREKLSPHDFRSIYLSYVQHCFVTGCALPSLARRVLGHCTVGEALHYINVTLENSAAFRGCLGNLLIDELGNFAGELF
jgi:hypothetical protein